MSDSVRAMLVPVAGGKADLADLLARVDAHLKVGLDGAGGGGGMEARVAKLESDIDHLKRDVGELRTDMRDVRDRLTRIETRVDHLPGKGFVVTNLVLFLAAIAALVTFQGHIQRLAGQAPLAVSPSASTTP